MLYRIKSSKPTLNHGGYEVEWISEDGTDTFITFEMTMPISPQRFNR